MRFNNSINDMAASPVGSVQRPSRAQLEMENLEAMGKKKRRNKEFVDHGKYHGVYQVDNRRQFDGTLVGKDDFERALRALPVGKNKLVVVDVVDGGFYNKQKAKTLLEGGTWINVPFFANPGPRLAS